ncbi:MAG TPA: DNA polymerase III subunit beta [Leucothrix mucor]|nr:DNA polymerase III subunit beta [Leucothrix mucor]
MKLTISRDTLLEQLNHVIGAIEKKQTKKILENVYISVENEKLTFIGTDLEIELSSSSDISSDEDGSITTSAKKMLDICKALPADCFILLETDDTRLNLKGVRSRFELSILPADDYPLLDDIEFSNEISIPEKELKHLFDSTAFSMANQDVRYYLNGLFLDIQENIIKTVTTDGHRLAVSEYSSDTGTGGSDSSLIIPRKGVLELSRLLDSSSDLPLTLYLSDNHIRVKKGNIRFTSKLIDGKYPDYQAAIPASSTYHIELDRLVFRDTLARVAILSNEKFRGIRLRFYDGVMTLHSTNPEKEMAEEEIDVNYEGDLLEIGFNVSYLLDAVNHLDTETVDLQISNPDSSALLTAVGDQATKYVVMPIRL